MKTATTIAICAVAAFFTTASFDTPAEAKKFKPAHVGKNVGKSVGRAARNTGRTIGNAARWGGNALWVGTGVGWGHARVTNNCTYYYNRYKETRAAKWKNQYNACIR
ncbi:hypothetical protein AUC71_06170 [Methyloceanibacter marginalis]|jgi:hypothetical protein|uniref:Lectin-like protein BA14k n=1 Tax=Methyloceanibacter marginalis TaxID=1774971 RepID=A0A1E3WE04_9HYPH|nr:hypothetical protein [Methyloceanibacter marginalis]ODS04055.1 hypothetical protein AUC71_06170 [Methyloceanibacter marginalis]